MEKRSSTRLIERNKRMNENMPRTSTSLNPDAPAVKKEVMPLGKSRRQDTSNAKRPNMLTINANKLKRSKETSPEAVLKKRPILNDVTNGKLNGAQTTVKQDDIDNKPVPVTKKRPLVKVERSVQAKKPTVSLFVGKKSPKESVASTSNDASTANESCSNVTPYFSANESSLMVTCIQEVTDASMLDVSASESKVLQTLETKVEGKWRDPDNFFPSVPAGVTDIDRECRTDPFNIPMYCVHIFNYLKEREEKFKVDKYLPRQGDLTKNMRAILVDWLVEVQQNFELNHESLYLAVKLVDKFLSVVKCSREKLQLIGAAAMLIAAKFDERLPPGADDFLYVCDDAYTRTQLLRTETAVLRAVKFDVGVPLSYSFLRRYAKCGRDSLELLTLSRYILETSLLDYSLVDVNGSLLAASSLYLAHRMMNVTPWSSTLNFYTGYSEKEVFPIAMKLNQLLKSPSLTTTVKTINSKYSHEIFLKVALIKPLEVE